jgi:hypothetical protein
LPQKPRLEKTRKKKERETSREYEYRGDPAFLKTPLTKEEMKKKAPKSNTRPRE